MACMVRAWRARRGSPPGAELALRVAARLRRWAPVAARLQCETAPGARARGGWERASAAEPGSESARSRSSPRARAHARRCGGSTDPRLGLGSLGELPQRLWSVDGARTQARYGCGGAEEGEKGGRKGTPVWRWQLRRPELFLTSVVHILEISKKQETCWSRHVAGQMSSLQHNAH